MEKILSCCGVICSDCTSFRKTAKGVPRKKERHSGWNTPERMSAVFINAV